MSHSIKVTSETEIKEQLRLAREQSKSVFVTSGGWNWGYGETNSIDPHAIKIDLSSMNKILGMDPVTGILRIEPGVTQEQLLKYLTDNNYNYCVPNTGAGSRGSILGNALERGFGIAPIHDHAGSILSVRGLLSDGSIYESALNEVNRRLTESFTWGVGPQLDKMISQSSWIIVTEVSIQLEKKPRCLDVMMLPLKSSELRDAVNQLGLLLRDNYLHIGSIKIFNQKQVADVVKGDEWVMTMVVYSHEFNRKQNHKILRSYFTQFKTSRKMILSERRTRFIQKVLRLINTKTSIKFASQLDDFMEMFHLANGKTSEVGYKALDVNYDYLSGIQYDMSHFKSKLTWFSPLCPLDGDEAERIMSVMKRLNTHEHFKFNTYTWTVLNKQTLALVIPILYNEEHEAEFWPWYKHIHLELKKEGFIPYRFHIEMMDFLKQELLPNYFKHVDTFEKAFDPEGTILRGKYS